MRNALSETSDFIRLYVHHLGEDEVPPEFHLWSCLSLLASCVADRVWIEKHRGERLAPNLYVFLIGIGAIGKNEAIGQATKFVRDIPLVNYWRGRATAQHLIDHLGKPHFNPETKRRELANAKLWFVAPELGMSAGSGDRAIDLIQLMTEFYGGGDVQREGTRTHGEVMIKNPCVNWIAGTTRQWLIRTVPPDAFQAGFWPRIIAIEGKYDLSKRHWMPHYPDDYDDVVRHLMARVRMLTHVEGQFELTAMAEEVGKYWYDNRSEPSDEILIPFWKRDQDLLLKFAMLASLSEGGDLVIDKRHIIRAQRLVTAAREATPKILDYASMSPETADVRLVADTMRRVTRIPHSALLRMVGKRGMDAERLRAAASMLIQSNQMVFIPGPKGGRVYVWLGGGDRMKEVE